MAAMSEDEIAATHLNEEIVRDAYEQYVLARKLYDHVLTDANVEISSDEARVIHLQKLLYVTQDLSETEVQEKKAAAEQAAARPLRKEKISRQYPVTVLLRSWRLCAARWIRMWRQRYLRLRPAR